MTSLCRSSIALILLLAISPFAWSGELAGLWLEYNDDSGSVEAYIRIEKLSDNSYEGRIEKILPNTAANSALICTNCPGSLRNHPLLGLRILSGMKRKDQLIFEGGEVLDPDDGKVYQCRIRLSEDGKSIEVTGYHGFSWIGQSETWLRSN